VKRYWGAKLVLNLVESTSSIAIVAAIVFLLAYWADPGPPGAATLKLTVGVGGLIYGLYGIMVAQLGHAIINIALAASDIALTAKATLEAIQAGSRKSIRDLKTEWEISEPKT